MCQMLCEQIPASPDYLQFEYDWRNLTMISTIILDKYGHFPTVKKFGHDLLVTQNVQESTRNHLRTSRNIYDVTTKVPRSGKFSYLGYLWSQWDRINQFHDYRANGSLADLPRLRHHVSQALPKISIIIVMSYHSDNNPKLTIEINEW